jgi:hypothetical protein
VDKSAEIKEDRSADGTAIIIAAIVVLGRRKKD